MPFPAIYLIASVYYPLLAAVGIPGKAPDLVAISKSDFMINITFILLHSACAAVRYPTLVVLFVDCL